MSKTQGSGRHNKHAYRYRANLLKALLYYHDMVDSSPRAFLTQKQLDTICLHLEAIALAISEK